MLFKSAPLFTSTTLQPLFKQSTYGLFSNSPLFNNDYTPEAQALFARMTTPPSTARAALINTAIASLISAGLWAKMDALWVLAAADSQAASLNWKGTSFTLAPVAAPTFTADRGYQFNGTTQYLTTGLNPTGSGIATINNMHASTWVNVSNPAAGSAEMGAQDAGGAIHLRAQESPTTAGFRMNSATTSLPTVANGLGLGVSTRSSSTIQIYYKNGTSTGNQAINSSAIPNQPFFLGAINNNGSPANFGARRVASASFGSGLDATDNTNLYNILNTYLTAVGGN